nr:3-ketoacyl-CoA thiolase 2, peroxisomal [Tanacetum cinerariifolium]
MTTLYAVNRQCSSGLQAVVDVAAAIKAGFYDIGEDNGTSSRLSSSNGDYRKCFTALWRDEEGTRLGYESCCCNCLLLTKRSLALQKGLPILGVFRTFPAVGIPPAIMDIGPAVSIPAVVKAAGLEVNDVDLFKINE